MDSLSSKTTLTDLFLSDYGKSVKAISKDTAVILRERPVQLFLRYFLDFTLSYTLYGICIVAFWRGTWGTAITLGEVFYGVSTLHFLLLADVQFRVSSKTIINKNCSA